MWSSMAHELGWWAVQPYMACLAAHMQPVCTSDSVASVVATLLLVNVTQAAPDTCALLQAAPRCLQQLFRAFDGACAVCSGMLTTHSRVYRRILHGAAMGTRAGVQRTGRPRCSAGSRTTCPYTRGGGALGHGVLRACATGD